MKRLLILMLAVLALSYGAVAQERGWVASLEFEESNHCSRYNDLLRSHAFKLGAAYNLPVAKGFFVRPKANINIRWGENAPPYGDGGLYAFSFQSIGAGVNFYGGYRIFRFLEFFTGPSVDWYFYNHTDVNVLALMPVPPISILDGKEGTTYAYWSFGVGIPLGRFTVEGVYRQHLNSPDADIQLNRWSLGVSYRF